MIKTDSMDLAWKLKNAVQSLGLIAKDGESKRAIASALYVGFKATLKRAKELAKPKRKKRKHKGFSPPPKRTGLLRKSYVTKKGVTKKGKGNPYAVLGPSKKVSGYLGSQKVVPSRYAHLVEFGAMLKPRRKKRQILGIQTEAFRAKRPKRGSILDIVQKTAKEANRLSNGTIFRGYATLLRSMGKSRTWVQGQYILRRAYYSTIGSIKSESMARLSIEAKKLVDRIAKRNLRKAGK